MGLVRFCSRVITAAAVLLTRKLTNPRGVA
jgi:hypothetical protein